MASFDEKPNGGLTLPRGPIRRKNASTPSNASNPTRNRRPGPRPTHAHYRRANHSCIPRRTPRGLSNPNQDHQPSALPVLHLRHAGLPTFLRTSLPDRLRRERDSRFPRTPTPTARSPPPKRAIPTSPRHHRAKPTPKPADTTSASSSSATTSTPPPTPPQPRCTRRCTPQNALLKERQPSAVMDDDPHVHLDHRRGDREHIRTLSSTVERMRCRSPTPITVTPSSPAISPMPNATSALLPTRIPPMRRSLSSINL